MRQPTTAEVGLDQHKAASFGPAGSRVLPFWLSTSRLRSNFVAAEPAGTEDRDQQVRYPGNVGLAAGSYSQHSAPPIGRPMGRCGREVRAQLPLQSGGRSDKATRIGYGHLATTPTPSRDGVEEHVDRSQIHMARVFRRHCPAGDYRRCARWRDDLVQFAEIHRAHGRGGRAADGRERRHDLGSD